MRIIEKLLCEELTNVHSAMRKHPKHKEIGNRVSERMEKFEKDMPQEDFADLKDVHLDMWEQWTIESEYLYVHTLKFAIMLMFEVFADDWGWCANETSRVQYRHRLR